MKRRGKVAIGVGVGVVAALLIAWPVSATAETHAIVLTADARPLICAPGQEVTRKFDGYYTALARLTPALDCDLRIHIYNDGILPVHLDDATYNLLGADGVTAHADTIDGMPSRSPQGNDAFSDQGADGDDAVGSFQDGDLAPGHSYTLVAHITASKVTCYDAGGAVLWPGNSPSIGVTSLGITESRAPTSVRFGFLGTKFSTDKACGN